MGNQRLATIAVISLAAGILVAGALILSGPGVRWDLWSCRTGLTILRWTAWSGLGVFVVSLIACFYVTSGTGRRGLAYATVGGLCGLLAFDIPASMLSKARSVPRIHDITTDTQNPPRFVHIVPLREKAKARNKTVYGGAKIAALQKKGYPDIEPLNASIQARKAFDTALVVAADLGWQIVASRPAEGRIEATDSTFWFGFKDDIVIRITALNGRSRIDIRSVSRVGRSDVGANAARIRRFTASMTAKLGL
jgi:uncharacterized protein (DUF1499 family)